MNRTLRTLPVALLTLAPAAHSAQPGPEAAAALARARDATGADRVHAAPSGILARGSSTGSGGASPISLLFSGPRAAVLSNQGPIALTTGIDGDTTWLTDIGGETRVLAGGDRETFGFPVHVLTHAILASSSPYEFAVPAEPAPADTVRLDFALRAGRLTGSVDLDPATGLPRAWTWTAGTASGTIVIEEYRPHAGVQVPVQIRRTGSDGQPTVIAFDTVTDGPLFVRSPYTPPPALPPDTSFDASAPAALEIVKSPTGHLLVHPRVNGQDVGWFIFDTGAGNSVLSSPVAKQLGLEPFGAVSALGVGGQTSAFFVRPATLTLGPLTMREPLLVGIDLSFLEKPMGRPIAGLVGYNVLARCIARIDMAAPSVAIHDPATFDGAGLDWQPLVIDNRLPLVEASFESHRGLFFLDTGAAQATVSMHEPAVRELKLLDARDSTDSRAGGVGGTVPMRRIELADFTFAGHRSERVPVECATQPVGAYANPYVTGHIGGRLLQPFVLVTDYPGSRIAFVRRVEQRSVDAGTAAGSVTPGNAR